MVGVGAGWCGGGRVCGRCGWIEGGREGFSVVVGVVCCVSVDGAVCGRDAVLVCVCMSVCVCESVCERDCVGETVCGRDCVGETVCRRDCVGETVCRRDCVWERPCVGETVCRRFKHCS